MEIQRASNLGPLHQKLGIAPDARVSYHLTQVGVTVWDIATGTAHTVHANTGTVTTEKFLVPKQVNEIIEATDMELQRRWTENREQAWGDLRQTIFTELNFRGISVVR
jgi:hypothetical protein